MSDPRNKSGPKGPGSDTSEGTVTATLPAMESAPIQAVKDEPIPIRLEVLGGPMDGLTHCADGKSFHIGRSRDCDLRLSMDRMVSGRHARISREGRQFWLQDIGSRNGTYVGDEKIENRILIGPGATFRVGRTVLEFLPG